MVRSSSSKCGGFDEAGFALAAAVDLAVDAVEVADFVGVEIHADRDAARTPAEDRVDEPVVLEEAGVVGVEGEGGHEGGGGRSGKIPRCHYYHRYDGAAVEGAVAQGDGFGACEDARRRFGLAADAEGACEGLGAFAVFEVAEAAVEVAAGD